MLFVIRWVDEGKGGTPKGGSRKEGPKEGDLVSSFCQSTQSMASDESSRPTIEELWAELDAAEAAVASFGPSPEQLRDKM